MIAPKSLNIVSDLACKGEIPCRLLFLVKAAKQRGIYITIIPEEPGPKERTIEMALTRKALKAMGLTDEQVDSIIEMHTETVDVLKKYKADAERLPSVQKELDDLKTKGDDGWKEKHDSVKKQFDDYKADIEAKEARSAKEKAVRAYYESKSIEGANLNLAMRSSQAEIEAVELDGDKIKDTAALDALVAGDFANLVTKPANNVRIDMSGRVNTSGKTVTKEDIMAIKDGTARRKAMAENPELFGLTAKT